MTYTAQPAQPNYSFNIETVGDTITITYKRAKYGIGFAFIIFVIVALITFIPVGAFTGAQIWLVVSLLLTTGIFLLINYSRKDGRFQITGKHIIVSGRSYDIDHINRFYIDYKSTNSGEVAHRNSIFMTFRNGLHGGVKGHIERNNYFIGFRYGEQKVKLAGGLKEDSADLLFKKVTSLTKGFNHKQS